MVQGKVVVQVGKGEQPARTPFGFPSIPRLGQLLLCPCQRLDCLLAESPYPVALLLRNAALARFQVHKEVGGREVEIQTDNKTVEKYLARGGGVDKEMNKVTKMFHWVLNKVGSRLHTAVWIRGSTANVVADGLSRWWDLDDWDLIDKTVRNLRQELGGWEVDHFASQANTKAPLFNTMLCCPGSEAANAFTQDWAAALNLWMPPIYLIG